MKYSTDCDCDTLIKTKVTDIIPIAGIMVEVKDAPALVCENCGEIQYDGKFILDLEKKLLRQQKQYA